MTEDAPDDLLLIGRVARAHGNRGEVIVNLDTDFADDRFRAGRVVRVGLAGRMVPRAIVSARFHQGRPVVALEGIATMTEAEALAGAELWIAAAELDPLPPSTFYRHDLVGCDVRRASGESVGRVTGVEGTLERSRLVVQGKRGEVLIPLTAAICVTVDTAARLIVIEPPDGLLDLNETRGSRR